MGWFTADNAPNNGAALRNFGTLLPDPLFDAKQRYIRYVDIDLYPDCARSNPFLRCMEHSVDLAAKTFAQAISPSSSQRFLKMKKALQVASDNNSGAFDLDDFDACLADFDNDDNDDEEIDGGNEEETDVDAADTIGKALLLVKQVSSLWFV